MEGVTREVRKEWFQTMMRKRVPRKLWDYGVVWVSEIVSMTHSSAGGSGGCIPLTEVTGDTIDTSECLDFGFCNRVWCHENAGLGPQLPGRCCVCLTKLEGSCVITH